MGFYEVLRILTKDIGEETFTKKELAKVTGLCHRSVRRHIDNLIKAGFVKVKVYRSNGEIEYQLVGFGDVNDFLDNVFGKL